MIIEFPRQNLKALDGQTLLEAFDFLIWTAEEVQNACANALEVDSSFPKSSKALLSWVFDGNVPFTFDVELVCRRVTAQSKKPDTYERVPNPSYRVRSGDAGRRVRRYIRRKVADGKIVPAKPEPVRQAVHLILSYLKALFDYISDGRIEISVRDPSGAREKLDRSDWRSRPGRIRLNFVGNDVLLPLQNRRIQRFSNARLVLADETRKELNKPPRLVTSEIADWLELEFFRYVKFCNRPKVFVDTKGKFPKLGKGRFKELWDKYAPQDWKKSGAIPKKYRGIKVLK
ncbi:hypothetical protein [Roseibium sp.]|uniref:hypothetical protein n=1 Tax=Roseibium sp. TaxID=1936156 RepID=UPI003A97EC4C